MEEGLSKKDHKEQIDNRYKEQKKSKKDKETIRDIR